MLIREKEQEIGSLEMQTKEKRLKVKMQRKEFIIYCMSTQVQGTIDLKDEYYHSNPENNSFDF